MARDSCWKQIVKNDWTNERNNNTSIITHAVEIGLNPSVFKIFRKNYKEIEINFDAKVVTIAFQRQTTRIDGREILKQTTI